MTPCKLWQTRWEEASDDSLKALEVWLHIEEAIGQRLPPGQPVYAANMDETLAAEIGFYTGRQAVTVDPQSLRSPLQRASLPQWLLVQDNHEGNMLALAPDYLLVAHRSFGPRRSLLLWQARESASRP